LKNVKKKKIRIMHSIIMFCSGACQTIPYI
jgi:hypothetical protein